MYFCTVYSSGNKEYKKYVILSAKSMKKKLVRITTVSVSLSGLLEGQLKFMSQFYEIIGISSGSKHLEEVAAEEGVRVIPLDMTRKITPFKDLVALLLLWRILRKEKPDIVHTHTPKAGTIGMIAAKLSRVPHRLHTIAGLPLMEARGWKRKLLFYVEKITYSCATKVYPNSKGLKEFVLENGFAKSDKLTVIGHGSSNGIDTSHFSPDSIETNQKRNLRESLNIKPSDFVFIFVGRLVGDKGVNELVRAFHKISKEQNDIKLVLLGGYERDLDPVNQETEDIIQNLKGIISTGWVDDVRPYFAISDCHVLPSYREGFPNVVMQAGSMGLHNIVTDINGCNEIIEDGVNGTIIPTKNTDAVYNAMKRAKENKKEWDLKKELCRDMIKNRYERSFVWNEMLKEYKNLK